MNLLYILPPNRSWIECEMYISCIQPKSVWKSAIIQFPVWKMLLKRLFSFTFSLFLCFLFLKCCQLWAVNRFSPFPPYTNRCIHTRTHTQTHMRTHTHTHVHDIQTLSLFLSNILPLFLYTSVCPFISNFLYSRVWKHVMKLVLWKRRSIKTYAYAKT